MRYFKLSEFDSPDVKGSGKLMNKRFLQLLDKARDYAETPFVITSGYRTKAHHVVLMNQGYQTSPTSAHLKGLAADIFCVDSSDRLAIIEALLFVGFRRLGISAKFIHVDLDYTKTQDVVWIY